MYEINEWFPETTNLQAKAILQAWEDGGKDKGLAVVDGKLVEELHVKEARKVLSIAEHSSI